MRNGLPILHVMGLMWMLFSLTFAVPLLLSLHFHDGAARGFLDAMTSVFATGAALWLLTKPFRRELGRRDGFLLVVLMWVGLAAVAAVPMMMTLPGLSFTDAFFESMSGLTTTGSTVLVGLDHIAPSVNFWRHELNWLGGMGIIVLAVAILPMLGVGGMQLFKAETPGPMKDSKLTPRITETAKALWLVYFGITAACAISLRLAGMNWFDAVCHSFSALSLGGFSTHDASVGYYNSPAIEVVLTVFMIIAALNFATHYTSWQRRSLKVYLHDTEGLATIGLLLSSILVIAVALWLHGTYGSFLTSLRHTSFNLVSIATDCGYASVDFNKWPIYAPLWMLFLSSITVSAGSTGGGIKMIRTMLLYKQAHREMFQLLHPQAVSVVKVGGRVIPNNVVIAVLGFIFLYFMSVVVLTFALMVSGLDFTTSLSAIIASINNMGPGLNQVGPASNYAGLSDFQKWVCAYAMLVGRLEVFSVLILFTPAYWRR